MERLKKDGLSLSKIKLLIGVAIPATLFSSCFQQPVSGDRLSSDFVLNTPNTVSEGYGRIFEDNPIIMSGNENLSGDANLAEFLESDQEFIVDGFFLEGSCPGITNCYQSRKDQFTNLFQSPDKKWAYSVGTSEFLQVNTFGHIKRILDKTHTNMANHFNFAVTAGLKYNTALPATFDLNKGYWKNGTVMDAYAECDFPDNASFSPSDYTICLGYESTNTNVKFSQDNTVTYHEVGHGINDIMLNVRNEVKRASDATFLQRSDLGYLYYDEAGSINEGLADFASYYMNGRTALGEWALGRFSNASRPMNESDSIHIGGISETESERLSYPTYTDYWAQKLAGNLSIDADTKIEDIHFAGQIVSHFLVAMTKDIESKCLVTNSQAREYVIYNLTETLAELGDLSTVGSDFYNSGTGNHVNMNELYADLYIQALRPIDFRSFSQTFGKNILRTLGNTLTGLCAVSYDQNDLETMMDQYGLLLFDNYNETMNGDAITGVTDTSIVVSNRKQTELLQKSAIELESRSGKFQAVVIDNQSQMKAVATALKESGKVAEFSTQIDADLGYNNGNGKVSPGELVGILINLYNNTNSTIAGARITSSDWAHFENSAITASTDYNTARNYTLNDSVQPCIFDNFPTTAQGAKTCLGLENEMINDKVYTEAECANATGDTAKKCDFQFNRFYPSCMVQVNDDNGARWATQEEFMNEINLPQNKCLDSSDPRSCFLRSPRGGDHAFYSKIPAGSTWIDEYSISNLSTGHLLYFEVSPSIPPGTIFNCRLRASFTNCSDCFNDGTNDYKDYQFMGETPFEIINIELVITD